MSEVKENPDVDLPLNPATAATAVEKIEAVIQPEAEPSRAASIMAMLNRATASKNVDAVKMREMFDLYREIDAMERRAAYDNALNAAQSQMEQVRTDADNPNTRSRYASYAALDRAIRPHYSKEGFGLSYNTREDAPADTVRVTCRVSNNGHREDFLVDIPADGKGARGGDVMTKTHAVMAAVTYGKRALLGMIFNIAVARDDDGNGASVSSEKLNAQQLARLKKRATEVEADLSLFCDYLGVEKIEDIPSAKFKKALAALDAKAEKKKGKAK